MTGEIYKAQLNAAILDISHRCDGPVTPYVAISRAMDLAFANRYAAEVLAEALDHVLDASNAMLTKHSDS